MQDFNPTKLENEKHSRTTQVRHGDALFDLIERASVSLAVEKSVFLRTAIAREAERVLERQTGHVLTAEDSVVFAAALDAPPEPTPRAKAAMRLYRDRVVHAD